MKKVSLNEREEYYVWSKTDEVILGEMITYKMVEFLKRVNNRKRERV